MSKFSNGDVNVFTNDPTKEKFTLPIPLNTRFQDFFFYFFILYDGIES